jgi:RNA polymerase sigma-70 factor, ECF subfamily
MADTPPDPADTDRLLEQARDGDARAFEQLFAAYRDYLRQVISLRLDGRLRARVGVSDVLQETQLEVFRRLADYLRRRPMPLKLWLRQTACERLAKLREHHVGAARRSLRRELPLPEQSSLLLARLLRAGGSTPSQQLARREAARRVNEALAQLPEADREVLLLRHFEGLSYEEVALTLGVAPAAARKRYGRALLRLQPLLTRAGLLEPPP